MLSTEERSVFISYSGSFGQKLALYLRDTMLNFSSLRGWVSNVDISAGDAWFSSTQDALDKAIYGIVCLTPGASRSPWVNFEVGMLVGRRENCKVLRFGGELTNPLSQFQAIEGCDRERWIDLLQVMSGRREQECQIWVDNHFQGLLDLVSENSEVNSPLFLLESTLRSLENRIIEFRENRAIIENIGLQEIIYKSCLDILDSFQKVEMTYSLHKSQYPRYLIALQSNRASHVKAIALVDIQEQFWRQSIGREILHYSREDNIRIFVFKSEKDFEETYLTLIEHSQRYIVYATSFIKLSEEVGSFYSRDFSIIESFSGLSSSKLLAVYDTEDSNNENIHFIADLKTIYEYEQKFEKLVASRRITLISKQTEVDINVLRRHIFGDLTPYERRTIEMSGYINIREYDEHEEKHAYYQDMMNKMIEISTHLHNKDSESCRVLEFGAGTGIFTKRLIQVSSFSEIIAVEIDWQCYQVLKHKFRDPARGVQIYHKDSRTFDPPDEYNFIFSSFADHHIKKGDKVSYFENIKQNLKLGGYLIVGDEFLRDYELAESDTRNSALNDYHNHIINIALQDDEYILADLERDALTSGLEEKGDYKVSCRQYEQYLRNAGFEFVQYPIGPLDQELREQIGGIYVYKVWLPCVKQ